MSVLPLHHETAKAIRADLTAAGIPYETDDGVADFHSLRVHYVSALVRAGASIKEVQTLARHAKPQTTLNHYAKVSVRDLRGAVESLSKPSAAAPNREAADLAATGTDEIHINERFALLLPYAGDGSGRNESVAGGTTENLEPNLQNADTPETPHSEGLGRVLSATDGSGAERGGFEPPIGFDTYNGLANRRFRPLSHLSRCKGCQISLRQPRLPASKRTKPARCQSIARFQAPDAFQREDVPAGKRAGGWG